MKAWRRPLDADTVAVRRGEVCIIAERCKGCGFCVEYCPRGVLTLARGFNRKGYHPPEVIAAGGALGCVACGLCEMLCPDFAIFCVSCSAVTQGRAHSGEGAAHAS